MGRLSLSPRALASVEPCVHLVPCLAIVWAGLGGVIPCSAWQREFVAVSSVVYRRGLSVVVGVTSPVGSVHVHPLIRPLVVILPTIPMVAITLFKMSLSSCCLLADRAIWQCSVGLWVYVPIGSREPSFQRRAGISG